jgi:hypothetical protein
MTCPLIISSVGPSSLLPLYTFLCMVKPLPALPLMSKYWAALWISPLAPSDGMSITTCSIPATPLVAISTSIRSHLAKTPGTPISPEMQNLGVHLTPQGTHELGDSPMSDDLQSSLSRLSNHGQYDNFEAGYDNPLHMSLLSIHSLF